MTRCQFYLNESVTRYVYRTPRLTGLCKEGRVVLQSPENTTRVILAKKHVAILPKSEAITVHYIF